MTKKIQDGLLMLQNSINDGSVIINGEYYHKFISEITIQDCA